MTDYYPEGVDEATRARTEKFFAALSGLRSESVNEPYYAKTYAEVLRLIGKGICLEATHYFSHTPLITLSVLGYAKGVEALIKAGADIEVREDYGRSALIMAANFGSHSKDGGKNHYKTIRALLDKGANICGFDLYQYIFDKGKNSFDAHFCPYDQEGADAIAEWQKQYADFVTHRTAPKSAADVYHLLAVTPLIDPNAPVDRNAHLRQIFLHADWPDKEQPRSFVRQLISRTHDTQPGTIINQLRADGTISYALGQSLLALTRPARKSALEGHGRGR